MQLCPRKCRAKHTIGRLDVRLFLVHLGAGGKSTECLCVREREKERDR